MQLQQRTCLEHSRSLTRSTPGNSGSFSSREISDLPVCLTTPPQPWQVTSLRSDPSRNDIIFTSLNRDWVYSSHYSVVDDVCRYSATPDGVLIIPESPDCHPAGHTCPCSSKNCSAWSIRNNSSISRPRGSSFTTM
jgi:hypothetical protein